MEVLISETPAEAAKRAGAVVVEHARRVTGRPPVLGLATGSSPEGVYAAIADAVAAGELDLTGASGFALDEYVGLPADHPQGYRQVLLRQVCEVVGIAPDRLHVPDGSGRTLAELEEGARAYERAITEAGGVDVQILGIGANGHLGFNEPGSAFASRTRVKRLAARTRHDNARFFDSLDQVPTHCVTQGLGTILDACTLVLIATGTAKAAAVAEAIEGPLTASVPASVLQWHADTVVCLDEAAASRLANREYYDDSAAGLMTPPA